MQDDYVVPGIPSGCIFAYGGTTAPPGWLLCVGTSVNRVDYPQLFAAIGTAFGTASASTFNLPDLRGRFLRGRDGGANRDPNAGARTAMATGGNTGDNVGSVQTDTYQSHTHSTTLDIGGNLTNGNIGSRYSTGISFGQNSTLATGSSSSGGNETRPLNANVNYIIKI